MGSKMGKREKAVFLEEAEGKRASSKVSLSIDTLYLAFRADR